MILGTIVGPDGTTRHFTTADRDKPPVYHEATFAAFASTDGFLAFNIKRHPNPEMWRAIFNTYVGDDSLLAGLYNAFAFGYDPRTPTP